MVELGVACINFGKPPEDGGPAYPGVSSKGFDPSGALKAYKENLKKEKNGRVVGLSLRPKLEKCRGLPPRVKDRIGDIMPGHASIHTLYDRLGYTFNPMTGLPVPPVEADPPPPRRKQKSEVAAVEPELTVLEKIRARQEANRKPKEEADSRLSLLTGWRDKLAADNTMIPRSGSSLSASSPNIMALYSGSGDSRRASCISATPPSCLSGAARSRLSATAPTELSKPFSELGHSNSNWMMDSRYGASLSPPGVQKSLKFGDMTVVLTKEEKARARFKR